MRARRDPRQDEESLERLIDRIGLNRTLYMIQKICFEKAEHIAINWQDAQLAKVWSAAGRKIGQLRTQIDRLGV